MSWLSEGIDAAAEWFSKNPELDRKVAFNQMVHRGYDRIRNNLNSITPDGYETMINRGNMPSVSDVKESLLGGENKQDGRIFADWQKKLLKTVLAGVGRQRTLRSSVKRMTGGHRGQMTMPPAMWNTTNE